MRCETTSRGARMLRSALGPAIGAWLQDPAVVEVMLNPDGRLWVDRLTDRIDALDSVDRDYSRHARRAVEIAAEYFEASRVLPSFLERACA